MTPEALASLLANAMSQNQQKWFDQGYQLGHADAVKTGGLTNLIAAQPPSSTGHVFGEGGVAAPGGSAACGALPAPLRPRSHRPAHGFRPQAPTHGSRGPTSPSLQHSDSSSPQQLSAAFKGISVSACSHASPSARSPPAQQADYAGPLHIVANQGAVQPPAAAAALPASNARQDEDGGSHETPKYVSSGST